MTASPEILASYNVLRHLAFADGYLDAAERDKLASIARDVGVKAEEKKPRGSLDEEAARVQTPSLRVRTFDAGIALANADGSCSEAEKAALDRLAKIFGFPPTQWIGRKVARGTPSVIAAKDEADERFLAELGAAMRHGELDERRYAELVTRLETEMEALAR